MLLRRCTQHAATHGCTTVHLQPNMLALRPLLTALTFAAAAIAPAGAIIAPNLSLATVPTGYFGGNYKRRGDANIRARPLALVRSLPFRGSQPASVLSHPADSTARTQGCWPKCGWS
jgi:hypothetical protein